MRGLSVCASLCYSVCSSYVGKLDAGDKERHAQRKSWTRMSLGRELSNLTRHESGTKACCSITIIFRERRLISIRKPASLAADDWDAPGCCLGRAVQHLLAHECLCPLLFTPPSPCPAAVQPSTRKPADAACCIVLVFTSFQCLLSSRYLMHPWTSCTFNEHGGVSASSPLWTTACRRCDCEVGAAWTR